MPWEIRHWMRHGWWPDEAIQLLLGARHLNEDPETVQLMDNGDSE